MMSWIAIKLKKTLWFQKLVVIPHPEETMAASSSRSHGCQGTDCPRHRAGSHGGCPRTYSQSRKARSWGWGGGRREQTESQCRHDRSAPLGYDIRATEENVLRACYRTVAGHEKPYPS